LSAIVEPAFIEHRAEKVSRSSAEHGTDHQPEKLMPDNFHVPLGDLVNTAPPAVTVAEIALVAEGAVAIEVEM
jgi:hypothetical protein